MKWKTSFRNLLVTRYLLIPVVVAYLSVSCNRKINKNLETHITRIDSPQVSWNILFAAGTNATARNAAIKDIQDSILNYYRNFNTSHRENYTLEFNPIVWCPCDSLLYNISFSAINGVGQSVIPPPPGMPAPAGSGNLVSVANISDNIAINELNKKDTIEMRRRAIVRKFAIDSSKVLAIIDSGIDTTLFEAGIKNLMWQDRVNPTIYNFLPFQPLQDFSDQTREKHGSAVTAVAVKAIEKASHYPKIMILKALNRENQGSIFSVSCALSYAIQKKANIINMSLGYYGSADSILRHYLELCKLASPEIDVVAAAGNTSGAHNPSDLCNNNSLNNHNLLNGKRMFYPACFITEFDNIISVTQLAKPNEPCFYQNYSNHLVSLGIIDNANCCAIKVGFAIGNPQYFEGSSFATPVASGLKMMTKLKANTPTSNTMWNSLISSEPLQNVTIEGKYIKYTPTLP